MCISADESLGVHQNYRCVSWIAETGFSLCSFSRQPQITDVNMPRKICGMRVIGINTTGSSLKIMYCKHGVLSTTVHWPWNVFKIVPSAH
jgi:hypothetical protein